MNAQGRAAGLLLALSAAPSAIPTMAADWIEGSKALLRRDAEAWRCQMRTSRFALQALYETNGIGSIAPMIADSQLLAVIRSLWLPVLSLQHQATDDDEFVHFDHYYTAAASCASLGRLVAGVVRQRALAGDGGTAPDGLDPAAAEALREWFGRLGSEARSFAEYQSGPWRYLQSNLRVVAPQLAREVARRLVLVVRAH